MLTACAAAQVKVTSLANEGVLLAAGTTKVVIDALFRDSLGDYARHSSAAQEALEAGRAPFDGVSLALATHYHLDHWDAGAISRFLGSNPAARFASTPQATGMLPFAHRARVHALWPADGASTVEAPGARVEAIALSHGGPAQNLAYRVELGGRILMHLGDAATIPANFEQLAKRSAPDVLFAPFWWLLDDEARVFVTERWKPKAIVAIHFGAGGANTGV